MGEGVKTAFVKMDEFHTFFLLIDDGIPVDFRSSRSGDIGEFAFYIASIIDKLKIPPENVYCEGRGWATPIKSVLKRRGIVISDMPHTAALRDVSFEIDQAYRMHHLRKCAEMLRKLEEVKV